MTKNYLFLFIIIFLLIAVTATAMFVFLKWKENRREEKTSYGGIFTRFLPKAKVVEEKKEEDAEECLLQSPEYNDMLNNLSQ